MLQVLLLAFFSIYYGLGCYDTGRERHDVLCLPIFHRRGRERLRQLQRDQESKVLPKPQPITISVASEKLKNSIKGLSVLDPSKFVVVVSEKDEANRICSTNDHAPQSSVSTSSNAGLMICDPSTDQEVDSSSSSAKSALQLHPTEGSLVLFPTTLDGLGTNDLPTLLADASSSAASEIGSSRSSFPSRIDMTVLLDEGLVFADAANGAKSAVTYWRDVASSWLSQSWKRAQVDKWPCLQAEKQKYEAAPEVSFAFGNLASHSTQIADIEAGSDSNRTVHHLSLEHVQSWMTEQKYEWRSSVGGGVGGSLRIVWYIPGNKHLVLTAMENPDSTSSSVVSRDDGNQWFVVVSESEGLSTMENVLHRILREKCLKMPSLSLLEATFSIHTRSKSTRIDSEHAVLPNFFLQRWYHSYLTQGLPQVFNDIRRERDLMLASTWRVPVTDAVADSLIEADALLQQATTIPNLEESYRLFLLAKVILDEGLRKNPALHEPRDMPNDHYAGIFVPLLLPLLLPNLLGLLKEWRRYRKLRKGKRDSQSEEKGIKTKGD